MGEASFLKCMGYLPDTPGDVGSPFGEGAFTGESRVWGPGAIPGDRVQLLQVTLRVNAARV